jgi:hypothetical protein
LIGHSFFCNANSENERKWFENIVKFEIRPLLKNTGLMNEKVDNEINLFCRNYANTQLKISIICFDYAWNKLEESEIVM